MTRTIDVEVVWGDITRAKGDVHAVGHYDGVVPQYAELALDRAISGTDAHARLLITQLTARGALRGALGEIIFFPWSGDRVVALAGMGQLGRFHQAQLQRLARSLATTVGLLPGRPHLATVLIGSGNGNLTAQASVQSFLAGVVDALERMPSMGLQKVSFVELLLDRALEIAAAVNGAAKDLSDSKVRIQPARQLVEADGGRIPEDFGCSMVLATLASASDRRTRPKVRAAFEAVLDLLPNDESLRSGIMTRLQRALTTRTGARRREAASLRQLAMSFRLRRPDSGSSPQPIPTRIAFWSVQQTIHAAAITGTTTVTERAIQRRLGHVERTIERLRNPEPQRAMVLGEELRRVLIPSDLSDVFSSLDPLIIEVDRPLSRVQWEMLSPAGGDVPLALMRPVARQLRTQYSPRPFGLNDRPQMRALVIGDPGDPQLQHSLPHARDEALQVSKILRKHGIDTTTLIGAPQDGIGAGPVEGFAAADFFDVVRLLLTGDFDLVHYCGHAVLNASAPDQTGWLFKDGLLTAHELDNMERPPRLVFANACVSLQLAQTPANPAGAAAEARKRGDAELVAGLADEFFRRGVADYVGTAWEVPSKPAVQFASHFYRSLLGVVPRRRKRAPLSYGDALLSARKDLYEQRNKCGTIWAAYQHYGDPGRMLKVGTRA